MMFLAGLSSGAGAQVLEPREMWEGSLDYATTGASQLDDTCSMNAFTYTCDPYPNASGVPDYQGDQLKPNSYAWLDRVPEGARIVAAYLIWMGSLGENEQPDSEVEFTPPAGVPYVVRSQDSGTELEELAWVNQDATFGTENYHMYTYRVEITGIMQEHVHESRLPINGWYKVSGLHAHTGAPYLVHTSVLAGWSVLIVYQHESIARKKFYWYTDFQVIQDNEILMTPAGFETPEDPRAKVTLFMGEGDQPISGTGMTGTHTEGFFFNGTALGDECNPFDNVYNSTINTNLPDEDMPCRVNQYSIDLDYFIVSDLLHLGDTSAQLKLSVGQDQVYTNYIVLSIDTKLPSFDIPNLPEKLSDAGSGGYVHPGEEYYYEIWVQNSGEDVATNVKVQDTLSRWVKYIPGSTTIDGEPIADLPGDIFPLSEPYLVADIMYPGASSRKVVRYGVRLKNQDEGITKEAIIENLAVITSAEGDDYETNGGIPVVQYVQLESMEGSLEVEPGPLSPPGHFVLPGEEVVLAQVKVTAAEKAIQFKTVNFQYATGAMAGALSSVSLYWDDDANADPTGDTAIVEGTVPDGQNLLDAVLSLDMEPDQTAYLLLTGVVATDAPDGTEFIVTIPGGGITIRGRDIVGLPFRTDVFKTPSGDLLVELGERTGQNAKVAPGSTQTAMQLKVTSRSGGNTMQSLTVGTTGSLAAAYDITQVGLFRDANGDGDWRGEDPIGQGAFSTQTGTMVFSNLSIGLQENSPVYLLVVVVFSPGATNDDYTSVIVNEGWASFASGTPEFASNPLSGPVLTISDSSGNPDGDGIDGDSPWADGDMMSDGDYPGADGDDPDGTNEKSGSGGGGCHSVNGVGAAMFFLLALLAVAFRMRRSGRL